MRLMAFSRDKTQVRPLARVAALAVLALGVALPRVSLGDPLSADWPHYLGDLARSHASSLSQITRENVERLEVAWTFDTGAKDGGSSEMQCSPIVVDGVLYLTNHSSVVFALDAATGTQRWRFDPAANGSASQTRNRGVAYWRAADGSGARIFASSGRQLWALEAKTGVPVAGFGEAGKIDLAVGLAHTGPNLSLTTPGAVYRDLLILGTRVNELAEASPGDVRAFDVRTGALRWSFHTIPHAGEVGAETWPAGAAKTRGGANAWAGLSVDTERGIVFAPTGSASPDFFGGDRPGENLFANSLIALDAGTGRRRWHFQIVRHDLWDRDLPSPPSLVRLVRDGRAIDAVAQTTKSGHVFVFDRETGAPLFPIADIRVPRGAVDGEVLVETQRLPTKPPPFTRQGFSLAMIDEDRPGAAEWASRIAGMRMGKQFIPPTLEGSILYPGYDGGAEWGGSAWDAETGLLFVNANEVASLLKLSKPAGELDAGAIYRENCARCHGADLRGTSRGVSLRGVTERRTPVELYTAITAGAGAMPGFELPLPTVAALIAYLAHPDDPAAAKDAVAEAFGTAPYVHDGYIDLVDAAGIPIHHPPWGTLTAIDLSKGELRWQIPLGAYPELEALVEVESERGVEMQRLSNTGTPNYGGPIVTAGGLLFIAATADETIRAFDKRTGEELWSAPLPASGFATPITYSVNGRQYVVVAAGGGKLRRKPGAKFVAFALPD